MRSCISAFDVYKLLNSARDLKERIDNNTVEHRILAGRAGEGVERTPLVTTGRANLGTATQRAGVSLFYLR
jgi:hypothetical protein